MAFDAVSKLIKQEREAGGAMGNYAVDLAALSRRIRKEHNAGLAVNCYCGPGIDYSTAESCEVMAAFPDTARR